MCDGFHIPDLLGIASSAGVLDVHLRKGIPMKKMAIFAATLATLSTIAATAPVEARGLHVGRAATGAAVAAAVAAGVAASAYAYGPSYYVPGYAYYDPGYVVYAGPHFYRGWVTY
jgi:hypothetical protein